MNTIEQAKKLLESGDIEQAKQMLLKLTESTPGNIPAWKLLCGISTRTEDWELGVISFGQLARLCPASSLAASGLVQSYMSLDRYDDALGEIKRFKLVADPDSEEAKIVINEHQRTADLIAQKKGGLD